MDWTDDDLERYLRRNGRRMKVHPEALLRQLQPLGFILLLAARGGGLNELEYLRPTPKAPGLFDILKLKAAIDGSRLAVNIWQSIVSHHTCPSVDTYVSATSYGYKDDYPKSRTVADAIELEARLVRAIPKLFADLFESKGRAIYEETSTARATAERYLTALQPSTDLNETLQRLRSTATEEQWQQTLEYVRRSQVTSLNLVDFQTVWEIAGLCLFLNWERPTPFRAIGGEVDWRRANGDDREADFRFHLVASRLARAPGWPIVDPLVPNRCDLEDTIVWRDHKPPYVAQVFDKYLATIDRRCACGKCLYYVRHTVGEQEPRTAAVLARCNNGHEETIELAATGLGTLLSDDSNE